MLDGQGMLTAELTVVLFEGELFEHNVQKSVIEILSADQSVGGDNVVEEDKVDDKVRKRLLRIQRQLA